MASPRLDLAELAEYMKTLATIGQRDPSILYEDRPTVKAVIKKDNKILIINDGLLPGGGIDPGESNQEALIREIQEEIGATIKNVKEIGLVVQYRNLINRRYIVDGYVAELETIGGPKNPQNEGEAQFTTHWLSLEDARTYVADSIEKIQLTPHKDPIAQESLLYNMMTTFEFLKVVR